VKIPLWFSKSYQLGIDVATRSEKAHGHPFVGRLNMWVSRTCSEPQKKTQTLSYICSGAPGLNGLSIRNNVVNMAGLKHALNAAHA